MLKTCFECLTGLYLLLGLSALLLFGLNNQPLLVKMPLTELQKLTIVALRETGLSINGTASRLGVTRTTVYKWLKRYDEEGNVERHRPRPRSRVTTAGQDADIVSTHSNTPLTKTRDTASRYKVSMETVRRRLHSAGAHCGVAKALCRPPFRDNKAALGQTDHSRTNGGAGNAYAPVRTHQDEPLPPNMFRLPRTLRHGDIVTVVCTLADGPRGQGPESFNFSLASDDRREVPCHINVDFVTNTTTLGPVNNGIYEPESEELQTSNYFTGNKTFELQIILNENSLKVSIDNSYLSQLELSHEIEMLKYIQVSGDIERVLSMSFQFA